VLSWSIAVDASRSCQTALVPNETESQWHPTEVGLRIQGLARQISDKSEKLGAKRETVVRNEVNERTSTTCTHHTHGQKTIVDAQERDKREKKEYRRRKTVERKRTSLDLWPTANHRGRRHPGWKGRRRHPYRAMGRRAQTLERAPGVQPEDGSGEGGVDWGALHPRGEIECARGGLACC